MAEDIKKEMENEEEKTSKIGVTGRHFSNKTGVISIDGMKTKEETLKEQGSVELMHSRATDTPLTMKMAGIEPFDDIRVAIGFYKEWKIMIPPTEFFSEESLRSIKEFTMKAASERGDNELYSFYRVMSTYSGAEIDFIPTEFHPNESIVVASRKNAMSVIRKDMWQAINTVTETNEETGEAIKKEEYLLKEGVVAMARVVGVTQNYVNLEVFGIETRVFLQDLSYTRVDNAKRLFEAGEIVRVVLTNVERDEEGLVTNISVSVKLANKNPQDITYDSVVPLGRYRGTVSYMTGYRENGRPPCVYVVLKNLGGGTVVCPLPDNIIPAISDEVDIAITRKYEKNKGLTGKILHVHRKEF